MGYTAHWANRLAPFSNVDVVDDSTQQTVFSFTTNQPIQLVTISYDDPDKVLVSLQDGTLETWSIATRTRISSFRRG